MSASSRNDQLLIAGGGIGGLASAIALARKEHPVHVLERAPSFSEVGAGIQLGPNATRILQEFGVWDALGGAIVIPDALKIRDGKNAKLLSDMPLGAEAERRYGAPYGVVFRSDLQQAMLTVAGGYPAIEISNGFEVADVAQLSNGVTAKADDGSTASGAALIGADGAFSTIRQLLSPSAVPQFSGKTAWRALLQLTDLPQPFDTGDIGLWLAPNAHLVHYPVQGGRALNVVAVTDGAWSEEGWNAEGNSSELLSHFSQWCEPVQGLLHGAGSWQKWALTDLPPLKRWHRGRIALLGDAAHPVLPFLAQGGALAIEDAAAMAGVISQCSKNIAQAFAMHQTAREKRTARVQRQARRMGSVYHLRGPARWGRDLTLRSSPPATLLGRFDWLYGARIESH
jgi:salicylate hydroxylase